MHIWIGDCCVIINDGIIIKDIQTKELSKTFAYEKYIDLIPKNNFENFPKLVDGIIYSLKEKEKITVIIDINKITIQESLKNLLELFEVDDVDVYNANLESVIRKIYEKN